MADKEKKPKESNRKKVVIVLLAASLLALLLSTMLYKLSLLLSSSNNKKLCGFTACIDRILEGPPKPDNPYIKKFLRSKYFDPPSTSGWNLSGINDGIEDKNYDQMKNMLNNNLRSGNQSFVVLGAGDGEYKDLTLDLEIERGWTGLMVEPMPFLYQKLREKNRNVETANVCISPSEFSWRTKMSYPEVKDHLSDKEKILIYRQAALNIVQPTDKKFSATTTVQCVPLDTVLSTSAVIGDEVQLLVLNMGARNGDVLSAINVKTLPNIKFVVTVTHADYEDDSITSVLGELGMVPLMSHPDLSTGPEKRKFYAKLKERIEVN